MSAQVDAMFRTLITLLSMLIAILLEKTTRKSDRNARRCMPTRPAFRVDGKTRWLHVISDGSLTLRFLHNKRGRQAIDEIGIIPRDKGILIHDCWAASFVDACLHQLCGSHLLRALTFVVDSNAMRWARLMTTLLRLTCHRVNTSPIKTLPEDIRRTVRTRYRAILEHGTRELPAIPPRPKGKRGRLAKSDAHNLHERLVRHEDSV